MKKHLFIALGAMTIAAAATSCKQELDVQVTQGTKNTETAISACVASATTGEKIAGVHISSLADITDSATTDAKGFAQMLLTAGTHKVLLKAEGYASIYAEFIATPLNGESATPIFGDTHYDVMLCPLNATLQGYVVLNNASSNLTSGVPAANATVSIMAINGSLIPTSISATTNSEGFFTMTAPAGGSLGGTVAYVAADSKPYRSDFSTPILLSNQTKQLNTIHLSPAVASNYTADITTKPSTNAEGLRLTFPAAIDTEKVKDGLVSVTNVVRVEVAYANNNRTLIITPAAASTETDPDLIAAGKKWTVGQHDFSINIKSTEGGDLDAHGSFEIK